MKEKNMWLLPAGKVENAKDLRQQLDIEEHWSTAAIAAGAALFVFLIACAVIAGLTFPIWKHFLIKQ